MALAQLDWIGGSGGDGGFEGMHGYFCVLGSGHVYFYYINGDTVTQKDGVNTYEDDYIKVVCSGSYGVNNAITYKKAGKVCKLNPTTFALPTEITVTAGQTDSVNVGTGSAYQTTFILWYSTET